MECSVCYQTIEPQDFDIHDSINERNPKTFKKGYYHRECFKLLIDESKDLPPKNKGFDSRLDEYYSRF